MIKKTKNAVCNIADQSRHGAFVEISYQCPHCEQYNFEQILTDLNNNQIYHVCPVCNKLILTEYKL